MIETDDETKLGKYSRSSFLCLVQPACKKAIRKVGILVCLYPQGLIKRTGSGMILLKTVGLSLLLRNSAGKKV